MSVSLEGMVAAFMGAGEERRVDAVRALRGEAPVARTRTEGPLLLGMGAAARLLGVSRTSLWRLVATGRLPKVELFAGAYRVRREDVEGLAQLRELEEAGKSGKV